MAELWEMFAFHPHVNVRIGRNAKAQGALKWRKVGAGADPGGRTNGMPWDGTSPCTVSSNPNAPRPTIRQDAGLPAWERKLRGR